MADMEKKRSDRTNQEPVILESDRETDCFQIVICDDESRQAEYAETVIRQAAKKSLGEFSIELFSSPVLLLHAIKERQQDGKALPDLIFMDIQMPEMDGIAFGKKLREFTQDVTLVFLTAFAEYALKGYEANAFRYLLKPVSADAVTDLLGDILRAKGRNKKLSVLFSGGECIVSLHEIRYLSSEDKYSVIHTKDRKYFDSNSLNLFEKILEPYGFYRIHRGYLVNMTYHRSIGKAEIVLSDNTVLPISRRKKMSYRQAVLQQMKKDILL